MQTIPQTLPKFANVTKSVGVTLIIYKTQQIQNAINKNRSKYMTKN